MTRSRLIPSLLAALLMALALPAAAQPAPSTAKAPKVNTAQVLRGAYLMKTSACMDCHTPLKMGPNGPEPDMSRLYSGHPQGTQLSPAPALTGSWMTVASDTMTAWVGPWGTSFTANLTPDPETGLGRWTEKDFIQTIRTGRHLGRGRPVLPTMPIPVYSQMTDADLKAIYAYLRTLPPIRNQVPDPLPPAAPTAPAASQP
ncbi:cytochrome c [Inhella sp.]|uniref:c-type cytochrome n=1 Tax=Inhella sp. TaxID=1921806 RepID=UPI0035B02BEE